MAYPIYQVDAFTEGLFGGNPAAVCPLEHWLPTETMQSLANENNLSETAFFVKTGNGFHIRWFTPEIEMDLAGHPTLAAAFVLFNCLGHGSDTIVFDSKSGPLTVMKLADGWLQMDFPARVPVAVEAPEALLKGLGLPPAAVFKSRDYLVLYERESEVLSLRPDYTHLDQIDTLGLIVTAKGNEVDFVSRFFVPNSVIHEDPVTGSAHATLVPFWAERLGKDNLTAVQLSQRKGMLACGMAGDRVRIAGKAVLYMKGEYYLHEEG